MLDFVRTKQKSILIKIAFGLIILSFVIGYTMLTAPANRGDNQPGDVAATVNGDDIEYTTFQQAYSSLYNLYQSIYKNNFNAALEKQLNLPGQALRQLVEEQLLLQQANEMNLSVSKQELIDSIAQYQAFQHNGEFNRDRYLEVLSYQRMTPEQFEMSQKRDLLLGKVRDRLVQGVSVSNTELEQAFHQENDKVNLNFVWLTPALVESKVAVTGKELEVYFKDNLEQFRVPEKISLRYLQFDPARYEDKISMPNDAELERYYRRHLDLFEVKEQVRAAHILISVAQDADEDTIAKRRELATQLLQQLKQGANFAALAKAHSDDKNSAEKGGELGTFERGAMVKEFEQAAFALRPGQLSDIVHTPFGFHLIKVEEYTEPGVKSLADVIDLVKSGLIAEKARQLAYEKAIDAYNINRKSGDLDAAAQSNDLGIKETGLFSRDSVIDGIGINPEISGTAFTLKPGELARPVQTSQGIFLFALKERVQSRLPELDEVRPAVESAFRAEQAQTLAHELAEKLLAAAVAQNDLVVAARELKLSLEETGSFSRGFGSFIPRIGQAQDLAQAAFSLTSEAPVADRVFSVADRFLVAALKKAEIADFAALEPAAIEQLQEQLLTNKKEQQLDEKIKKLISAAQIEVFVPNLIGTFNKGA